MTGSAGELAFVAWVRQQVATDARVVVGPGDDAAVIRWPEPRDLVVTTDMVLEGSCFALAEAGPWKVGRKALAVNLSDIAAMAARPVAAVVSVALPRSAGAGLAQALFTGMSDLAREFACPIVGGDTNSWNGPLAISVTLIGETTSRGPVRRAGARPGDHLFVTGPLGGSIAGHHLDFTPRVREALALHEAVDLHAMIDISDGLALDLHRLCQESKCGAVIRASEVPIRAAAAAMTDGRSPLDHALSDGEDFELLFAVSPTDSIRFRQGLPPVYCIGEVTEGGIELEDAGGRWPLPPRGYEHQFGNER